MIADRYKYDGKSSIPLNDLQKKTATEITEKVANGVYHFEENNCPICASGNFQKLSEKDRYGLLFTVVICKNCGLVQTNPRMTLESYIDFYKTEYRKLYVGFETATEDFFNDQLKRGKNIISYLKSNKIEFRKTSPLVLEIGCGAGGILQAFRNVGFQTKGIDPGSEYINYGKSKFGLDLEDCTLHELIMNEKPDLVIYSHVLEHILDVNKELTTLKTKIHDQTKIYIEVPSILNVHVAYDMNFLTYFQNAHTYHFCLASLENLMCIHDLKKISGNEYVQSVFIQDATVNKKIINTYTSTMQYIKFTEGNQYLKGYYTIRQKIIQKLNSIFTKFFNPNV